MAAGDPILDLSDLVNLSTGGSSGSPEQINFHKTDRIAGVTATAPVAGRITSFWMYDGAPGAASSAPTTATITTNATAGALKQTTSATSARKRLLSFVAVSIAAGSVILYDRLAHHGGMVGNLATAQTTNIGTWPTLTRHTSGVGVEMWAEIYTLIGVTATTLSASYKDGAGSTQTSPATTFGGASVNTAGRLAPLPLVSGGNSVSAVISGTLAATSGTAGNWGFTLAYPLITLPLPIIGAGKIWSGIMSAGGPLDLGATSDACLALAFHPNTTTVPTLFGTAYFMEK